jgi:putative flippase GtrA
MLKIKQLFKRLNKRYLVIGVSIYILELVIIVVAQSLGASGVVAVGLSFWVGLVVAFVLQKIIGFSDKRLRHTVLIPQVLAFSLLVLFNFGFTLLVTKLLSPPLPAVISRTIALGLSTVWNYYLYKQHIFSNHIEVKRHKNL